MAASRDVDTFIQQFVGKAFQVIVQSRLGSTRTHTKCEPNGKEWFNLEIPDHKDISEQVNKCLKVIADRVVTAVGSYQQKTSLKSQQVSSSISALPYLKSSWKMCCEMSVKNIEGACQIIEYWLLANQPVGSENSPSGDLEEEELENRIASVVSTLLTRMSCMLKSLIVLTRSTPSYRLTSKGATKQRIAHINGSPVAPTASVVASTDEAPCTVSYRVFNCDEHFPAEIMDAMMVAGHLVDLRVLGSIKSPANELSVSFLCRDMRSISGLTKSILAGGAPITNVDSSPIINDSNVQQQTGQVENTNNLEMMSDGSSGDPISQSSGTDTATVTPTEDSDANGCDTNKQTELMLSVKDDHFKPSSLSPSISSGGSGKSSESFRLDIQDILKPLNPAFASCRGKPDKLDGLIIPMNSLLLEDDDDNDNMAKVVSVEDHYQSKESLNSNLNSPSDVKQLKSKPITIPSESSSLASQNSPQMYSTSNDSFVFVELRAPFASDNREFGSFFHGPSPTFMNESVDSVKSLTDPTAQLAEWESNAPQIDSFVDSVLCDSETLQFEG